MNMFSHVKLKIMNALLGYGCAKLIASRSESLHLSFQPSWAYMTLRISATKFPFHHLMHHFIYDQKAIFHNKFRGRLLCAGNLGNMLLIIIPAVCDEDNSPFGDSSVCSTDGESYAALSMAVIVYCFHSKIT